MLHKAIFLAACNANVDEKDIAGFCRILDRSKLSCGMLCHYLGKLGVLQEVTSLAPLCNVTCNNTSINYTHSKHPFIHYELLLVINIS